MPLHILTPLTRDIQYENLYLGCVSHLMQVYPNRVKEGEKMREQTEYNGKIFKLNTRTPGN